MSAGLLAADQSGAAQPPDTSGAYRELGSITISEGVVAKLAARAVLEIPDAGGAAPRVFGRVLPGAGHLGIRETGLTTLPRASAEVDGSVAIVEVAISVRWPAPVPQVSDAVRRHLRERVHAMTGLAVAQVRISVTDLVTHIAPPRRVR